MEDNDAQLQLKKRARRRLVGAVAFAGFAAVVLPMIMDQEPQPAPQDVEIRIPGQDEKPFAPKFASAPAPRAAEAPVAPAPVEASPSEKSAPVVAPAAAPAAASLPAARVVETSSEKTKAADKPLDPAKKAAEKPAEKVASAKLAEKAAEKATEKPTEKPSDSKAKESEAARAAAILSGKAEPTAKTSASAPVPSADGQYVILIGAFADQANVKNLQTKLSEQGIKVYTEPLDSPQGKKIRVRAGPFASKEAGEKALEKMKRIGVSGVLAAKP